MKRLARALLADTRIEALLRLIVFSQAGTLEKPLIAYPKEIIDKITTA